MDKSIIPVLLGADLNCYSVARAFHEAYNVPSYAFGKKLLGESAHSKIIKFTSISELSKSDVLCSTLEAFAKNHSRAELYLVPCTDEYALAIAENQEFLKKYYIFLCPEPNLAKKLSSKEFFSGLCREHNIPFPKSEFFYTTSSFTILDSLPFPYPIIIKPSCSAEYWRTPFDSMKKVYTAETPEEAQKIISKIFSAGYRNSIVLQEMIPAKEDEVFVLTAYADKNSKVRAACMGRVLLGEHTPKGLGNHVAIVTEYHEEITQKLCDFLENISYCGFANFDILYDKRDNSFKVLELNTRQGRSNYYMTAAGMNIARIIVESSKGNLPGKRNICQKNIFWHTVPKTIIYRYITDKALLKKVKALAENGKKSTTLFYLKDLFLNPLRAAYVFIHNVHYFVKYNKYR